VYITSAGVLMAVPFDAASLELRGEPVPVLERVAALAVSGTGRLAYREGQVGDAVRAVWVDRTGKATVMDSSWIAHISSFALSPDGRRLAVSVVNGGQQNIWIKELPRGPLAKFTFGTLNHFRPIWSIDGKRIWFVQGDTTFRLAEKNSDGSGDARPVVHGGHQVVEGVMSRDGRWLLMRTGGTDTSRLLLTIRSGVDTVAQTLPSGPGSKLGLAISPDARFVAYTSGISGSPEVYVSPFPDMASARWQVSLAGGSEARWSNDGRELFFVNQKDELMAAKVVTTPTFSVTSTERLFDVSGHVRDGGFHVYEQEPNGNRFFMLRQEVFPGDLVLVDNWFSELRDKLKSKP
jgi:serine/threonine-protein kinase